MKTKTIQIKTRIDEDSVFAIQNLLDLATTGEESQFDIYLDDLAENRMSAFYEFEGSEISETFIDKTVFEDYFAIQNAALENGTMCEYKGNVVDANICEDGEHILFDVEIPLLASEDEEDEVTAPAPLADPKTFTPMDGTPEPQKYEIKIVGIRHHASETAYARMSELSRNRGEVILRHETGNEKDATAVASYLPSGEKVGYVAAQYLPVIYPEVKKHGELTATVTYMETEGASATALLTFESGVSAMAVQLFSRYTPAEVYKSSHLYLQWGGILEPGEACLLATDEQKINFDEFFALDINAQNQIASEWNRRMHKATVENPTNPGKRMSVPLELSMYGTSWKELDLENKTLIQTMELDNKVVALYFRYRRSEPGGMMVSPQEFVDEVVKVSASEELMKRLGDVFEKRIS